MLLRRVLQAVNIAAGAALLLALGGAWWYLWRPIPQTSGRLRAPVSRPATVARDARGAPLVAAASLDDLFFAQGFATAQDRMWQMDMLRRTSAGELAEVAGRAALELDITARKLRARSIAEALALVLPAAERAAFAAYARGVNHYLDTYRLRLPPEFHALGYRPRPWRVADSLLVALQMNRTLTSTWERELEKARLRAQGDAAKVDFLYPLRSGFEPVPGSNAWALAGAWTASGKPLLANDPHLEWSIPSAWVQVQLQAPGLHAAGVTVPGLPGVLIGHNQDIAWGITSLEYDEQDLYREEIDIRTGRYLFKGEVRQARREIEYIAVKGERAVEVPGWITVHGPLFASDQGRQLALRWAAAETAGFSYPVLDLNRARNWEEFRAALRRFPGPGFNFLYADRAGHIGHQVAGRLPSRPHHNGDVPAEGKTGAAEWDGFIAYDDLPSVFDPPSGLLVSANQNPFPAAWPHRQAGHFAPPGRARQIEAHLRARRGWKPGEMLAIQKDVYSAYHHFLARTALQAAGRGVNQPQAAEVLDRLKTWDGQMDKDLAAPFAMALFDQHLRSQVLRAAAGGKAREWRAEMASAVVERLLRERPAGWFADYDKMILISFTDALDEAARLQGRNPGKWSWGRVNQLTIPHPVARNVPWLAPYFRVGPVPMSGAATTVKQTTAKLGPSLRFVADTADWDNSLLNLATGQSGHLLTFHYKDQWDDYYVGRGIAFPFKRVKTGGTLTLAP